MQQPLKVFLIEPRRADSGIAAQLLTDCQLDFSWQRAESQRELAEVAEGFKPHIVLCIDTASANSNRRLLEALSLLCAQTPVILVSSVGEIGHAASRQPVARPASLRIDQQASDLRRGFSAVLESSVEPAVIGNAEGWITHANTSACRLLELCQRSLVTVLRATHDQTAPMPHWLPVAPDDERRSQAGSESSRTISQPCHHRLAYLDPWSLLPTLVHVTDLIGCLTLRNGDHCAALPLIAMDPYGARLPDGALTEAANHGSIVRITPDDFLVVLPDPTQPAHAAIAVEHILHSIETARWPAPILPAAPAAAPIRVDSSHRMKHGPSLGDAMQRHALSVHYQPQFDVKTGRGCGVEALARWVLCSGESIAPSVFIPVAERSGLIHALGAWMLDSACETAYAWCSRDAQRTTLSVNVSALQIDEDFNAVLGRTLEKSHFPAKQLELEITESALIANPELTIGYLKQWKEMGVRIAMDDFGTGYSSLSYLSRLPVDCLKLDQSLVHRMTQDVKTAAVARLIVSMGAELGIDVVAEGVETERQLAMLTEIHCPRVQGFLLGRPMPAKQAQIALRKPWGNRAPPTPSRVGTAAEASYA
jgi:EAL domain-containing protein (putative c-di-GMP-specific phosphodiesterase class I)